MGDPAEQPTPKHSATVQLVIDIEMFTASAWTQIQREEVADMIRKYRFNEVGSVKLRIEKLVRECGSPELSEKIYMTRF